MMVLMLDLIVVRSAKYLFLTKADGPSLIACGNAGRRTPELPA
jgi:hypothetical protein